MKQNKTAKTETTRRAFISKGGLLLAGTVLASSGVAEIKAKSASFCQIPDPQQDIAAARGPRHRESHFVRSGCCGWLATSVYRHRNQIIF